MCWMSSGTKSHKPHPSQKEEGCNHRVVPKAETWCDQSDPCSSQNATVVMEYNYVTMC